jgi:uncharacterized Ntn-hydrolase superfamily protein
MLVGAGVLNQTANTYRTGEALPFPRRLVAAMLAGEGRGGDKRGKQSAALLIYGEKNGPILICASTITPSHWPSSSGSSA